MRPRASLVFLFLILTAPLLLSQMGQGSGKRTRNYDPATEMTVKGTVEDVTHPAGRNGAAGTHLVLKADQGALDVHLGPSSYLSSQQFTFAKGDSVEVVGSKAKVDSKDVLIARQVTKDGKVLTLRNALGVPLWSRSTKK
jgi:DNA/RNA endonuclease YhcR with UshA esterase domain